jgi:hypothetical protein
LNKRGEKRNRRERNITTTGSNRNIFIEFYYGSKQRFSNPVVGLAVAGFIGYPKNQSFG